ncbi:methionine ABC transporter permease [Mergibacter septicus]|uniref:Probable D-methionine transport system permease protein MetI n=1 Tax=Mergibacter septicus TaxID=221402 RepID=A0A8E3MH18_9PAST|nr:methionine ABC transporter permease [Mergibacter septicus]AWX15748.1 methionine ABC transporter permease [Mergibacter septicus]QDJ13227.1 methionine ABC transporter permease [Mergibacter septicus]QDJ15001.1 methionine ABC transporter permease [Mergibacter septicus]UTU47574.1 ABC transporter permease [Mergibacter septicus]WMR95245.1 methionine ABC transporter permease [Mergibacter septicus]
MFEVLTPQVWGLIGEATLETLYMVFASGFFAALFGIPLGIVLFITKKGQIKENQKINFILSAIVNIGRSVPFVILLVAIIPFTMFVLGTFIGTTAAIVPLTVSAIPFVARLVEGALMEVPSGLVEAARAMGATNLQIITKFLLPEALPAIINAITITLVALVNYSAMAGTVGGGGLGYVGIQYGYQTYVPEILITTIVILVIMVQIIQTLGDYLVSYFNHK